MKKSILTISILFLFFLQLKAENSELEKLKAERRTETKKVIEKYKANLKLIDQAYLKKLKEMMKFFIKKGDLDGAVAVRSELKIFKEKLGISDQNNKTKPNKEKNHHSTEKNTDDDGPDDKPEDKVFGEEEF